MVIASKQYNFKKSVILNAVYDSLDAMGFYIESSDSEKGCIKVSTVPPHGKKLFINLSVEPLYPLEEGTEIKTYAEEKSEEGNEYAFALMDEIDGIICRSGVKSGKREGR